jgi:hypothetical protein
MRRSLLFLAITASMLVTAPFSHATIIQYTADLNGSNESPANASSGIGSAIVTIDDVLNTMRVQVSFADLTGVTTAAHIHCCTATPLTGTVGVATTTPTFSGFPLGVTSGTYDNTLDMTLASSYNPSFITANGSTAATAEMALFSGMAQGRTYFNVHTTVVPGGEIRGFITPASVPEPATLALLGIGMAAIGYQRRKSA